MSRTITLAQAESIIAACKTEAEAVGQPMNIAVVDDGGQPGRLRRHGRHQAHR